MFKSNTSTNKTWRTRIMFPKNETLDIFNEYESRMGIGTEIRDIRINPVFSSYDSYSTPPLSVEDLYHTITSSYEGGKLRWKMFTLTGINFIQGNGSRNAEQFENLTKSVAGKSENIITKELLYILSFCVKSEVLVPLPKWKNILESCEKGKIV